MIPSTLLVVLLTRFNRVVFDSFLHFHSVAAGDGSALEEGKTRKVTVPHTYDLLYFYGTDLKIILWAFCERAL